jgi:hypothetical protein
VCESVFIDADANLGCNLLELLIPVGLAKYSFTSGRKVWRVDHLHWVVTEKSAEEECPRFRGVNEVIYVPVGTGDV